MRILITIMSVLISVAIPQSSFANCNHLQPPFMGKVRFVSVGEDYKIRKVSIGEDIKIRMVKTTPIHCGEWQQVKTGEDFTVRFVTIGEDFKIRLLPN